MRTALLAAGIVLASCWLAAGASARSTLGCHVNVWVGGRTYSGTVQRSWRTSCPFARRVTAKSLTFIVKHGGQGDGDFFVRVYSPVTLKTYRMHCFANGDLNTSMHVDCRGGIGARVVYRAHRG